MELTQQEQVRRDKLEEIKKICNPYPEKYQRTHLLKEAKLLNDGTKDVSIAGRIIFARKMGKLSFAKIRDLESDMQLEFRIDVVGEEKYSFFKKLIDTGDFIGAKGEIFTTQTGEKTLRVEDFTFLGKALRPLPEKYHGLSDIELKYRQRYNDLITNEETRKVFLGRSKYYLFLRNFLANNGFLEVETPIIQTTVSGASAKPFFTHYNALNMDCNLRIAPECYLKELIAGGFDKVYEVAKCFRNEGMDQQHNPEFTQVEWYCAYWNFEDNINFFEKFLKESFEFLTGSSKIEYQGHTLDFGKPFERVNYIEKLTEVLGFDFLKEDNVDDFKKKVIEKGLYKEEDLKEYKSIAQLTDFLYKKLVRANIIGPVVMYNYPASLKPLARRNDKDKNIVDCFQVVVCGSEICNAYSELVDPSIQRQNFEDQLKQKASGDDETMDMDVDYLNAMEQGMPPISGLGFGIDRLMMIAFNQESVRDVVLFPTMKPDRKVDHTTDFSKVKIEDIYEDIPFDDFSKCDIRAVKVKGCEAVKKSKKLLKFTLDDGTGKDRIILSGIHAYYEPEELLGKTLLAIVNIPPRSMMGIESNGMILSAVHNEDEEKLNLLMLDNNIPAGAKIY